MNTNEFQVCIRNLSTQREQWFSLPSQRPALYNFVNGLDYLVVAWEHCSLDIPEFTSVDLLCRIGEIIAANDRLNELYAIGSVLCDIQEIIEKWESEDYLYYPTEEYCSTEDLGSYVLYEGLWEHEDSVNDAIRDYIDTEAIGRDLECSGFVITKYGTVKVL